MKVGYHWELGEEKADRLGNPILTGSDCPFYVTCIRTRVVPIRTNLEKR